MKKGDKKVNHTIDSMGKDIARAAKKMGINPAAITKADYYGAGGDIKEWDFRRLGGFSSIVATLFKPQEEKDLSVITDTKQLKARYSKLEAEMGSRDLFFKRVKEAVSKMSPVILTPYKVKKKIDDEERSVNLTLSDLHFGSDLKKEICGHQWGRVEEARALAKVVENVISYKTNYRPVTTLIVNILGDVIQNELHGKTSADILHFQTCRAMYLLTQALARFAEHFREVRVNLAVGNHGRDIAIHHSRATAMKINALETTVYYGVINALRSVKNIHFNFPQTPWVTYQTEGHKVYATHGDTHLNPGNPGAKLEIRRIEEQVNKINASLKDHEEYKIFIAGHVHTALATQLGNGAYLITNGALTPPDEFAKTLNIMESQQIQVMFESTASNAVGDKRFINVTGSENDVYLDKLIKPFTDLNE